jgi:hypothetical protein
VKNLFKLGLVGDFGGGESSRSGEAAFGGLPTSEDVSSTSRMEVNDMRDRLKGFCLYAGDKR